MVQNLNLSKIEVYIIIKNIMENLQRPHSKLLYLVAELFHEGLISDDQKMRLKEHIFINDRNLLDAAQYNENIQDLKHQLAEYGHRLVKQQEEDKQLNEPKRPQSPAEIDYEDILSPLDAQIAGKKRMKGLRRVAQSEANAEPQRQGLRVVTQGLNLMSQVVTCDEGMSPLMERFQAKSQGR